VGQTASYAVASGKRVAILCVLDCSKKQQATFAIEDGFDVLMHQEGPSVTFIITILIQGNFAKPSSLSQASKAQS
jgi:hypothetical protein